MLNIIPCMVWLCCCGTCGRVCGGGGEIKSFCSLKLAGEFASLVTFGGRGT